MKQLSLSKIPNQDFCFGGQLLGVRTNPKVARPLSSKLPVHLVLRSNRSWMRGPKYFANVDQTVHRVAKRHGVRIYEYANVGNHLHVLIRLARRSGWAAFIRELTGRLAMLRQGGAEWARRPFTRVVNGWKKAYRSVREYVRLNASEAEWGLNRSDALLLMKLSESWLSRAPG